LYRWDEGPLDESFWTERLQTAISLRHEILGLGSADTAYRLVFSEGDSLSGLTVDRYDRWLVAQFSSLGLHARRDQLLGWLHQRVGVEVEGIIARTDRGIAEQEGLDPRDVFTWGSIPDEPVPVVENGLTYQVDLRAGQKTGFYCDQRDNRQAVARYCQGKRVLDLFCFTGGFTFNALRHGGALMALGVDSSAPSIALARRNAAINQLDRAAFEAGDVFQVLEGLKSRAERFDVVICDPPKYARHAKDLQNALKGYLRLNLAALEVLEPGGILATCSCSGHINRAVFAELLGQVAEQSDRPIQILDQRGQGPDHPISTACPETEYLKCFLCRVL
jgi:23S rRNA (cytosine1962-C5)-methyltransferase